MNTFLALLLSLPMFATAALAQDVDRNVGVLEVISADQALRLNADQELSIKFWLQQLMLSALYRNVVLKSDLAAWREQITAEPRIHCSYPFPTSLAIPERQTVTFDEVLLPLDTGTYPDYIYVKRGDVVLRLAKYDPWVFHKLIFEAGLPDNDRLKEGVERTLF